MPFSSSPKHNDRHWQGEQLYEYDSSTSSWNRTMDLTPIHHWRLNDDGAMNTASDSGSHPVAGSIVSCILSQTGVISRSTWFTGTSSYINFGSINSLYNSNNTEISVLMWAKPTAIKGDNHLFAKYRGDATGRALYYLLENAKQRVIVSNNGTDSETIYGAGPTTTAFSHIGFTFKSGAISVYYNGGVNSSTTFLSTTSIFSSTALVLLGAYDGGGSAVPAYDGYIEDVRVYDRVLTQQEINAIYNKGRGTYARNYVKGWPTVKPPIHHWKLQEMTGTVAMDSGSTPIVGSITSCVLGQLGQVGNSYQFTGSSYADFSSLPTLCDSTKTKASWMTWVNFNTTGVMGIISKHSASDNQRGIILRLENNVPELIVSATGTTYEFFSGTTLPQKEWHHIAYTYNAGSSVFYSDGLVKLIKTLTITSLHSSTAKVVVGGNWETDSATAFYTGYLEDVRIYDYALSPQEIQNIYNLGMGTLQ